MVKKYDFLIVGAGYAGAVCARQLADAGKKVVFCHLLLETDSLVFELHPQERFYEVYPEPLPKTNGESAGGLSPESSDETRLVCACFGELIHDASGQQRGLDHEKST
jgi:short subunit dehydrogenase-like uncharacterized protein